MTRTLATAGRVLSQVLHDHRTLALLLVVPSLLIGLMSWLFSDTELFKKVGPAVLGLFPFIIMFLVTSIATLRERRSGTLERLLALPVSKLDFILGYTLVFGLLAASTRLIERAGWHVAGVSAMAARRRRGRRRRARCADTGLAHAAQAHGVATSARRSSTAASGTTTWVCDPASQSRRAQDQSAG